MKNFFKIAAFTLVDQMKYKSFYVLLVISILFVLMIRGCYQGEYIVNGKQINNITLAWYVSKIVFQIIAVGMFIMVSMLSMKIFSKDEKDGSLILFLSRPVFRWQYVLGRIAGTWALCFVFMFLLHLTIFLTLWQKTGSPIPGYLTASLVCSINLLFVIVCVCFLSLFMPDFISAVFTMGILLVGFISDGGYQILNNEIAKSSVPSIANTNLALWRILYPKVFMVQAYADSIISRSQLSSMGPFHPMLNLSVFILLIIILLLLSFNKKEI
jgi:ABC-type transport system involved in multi-copper enzyme maturation permease subunit